MVDVAVFVEKRDRPMINIEYGCDPWGRSVAFQIPDDQHEEIEWESSVASMA